MKSYQLLVLFFALMGTASSLNAQQLQKQSDEVTSSWKKEIERYTTEYRIPLAGAKAATPSAPSNTPPSVTTSNFNLNKLLQQEQADSKSGQYAAEVRQKALEELLEKTSGKKKFSLPASQSTAKSSFEISESAKKATTTDASKDYSDVMDDDPLKTIKQNAQAHIHKMQQERLASGYYRKSDSGQAMGEMTSLQKTRPEMYQQRQTSENKRVATQFSGEPYRPDRESYLNDLKKGLLENSTNNTLQRTNLSNKRTSGLSNQRNYTIKSDSLALVDLYNALGGPSWYVQDNWLSGPVETWYGVSTTWYEVFNDTTQQFDFEYHVIGLYLGANNLSGSIPASIGSLDSLQVLGMHENTIVGALPSEIANCTKLRELTLGGTFIDALPQEIGNLSHLQHLSLWNKSNDDFGNFITDGITDLPSSIWNLTNLLTLDLGGHSIASIDGIGNLTQLTDLWLWGNNLTAIPAEIGTLVDLKGGYFGSNPITSLPVEIGNLTNAEILNFGYCQLTSLPDEIGSLNVWQMELFANNLQSLPATFNNLDKLREVRLWGNNISAPINILFGMDSVRVIDLWANAENGGGFYGTLDGISSDPNLETIWIGYNKLSGVIPSEMGQLQNLIGMAAEINSFTGIDPALLELPKLSWLNLHTNQIGGSFPVTTGTDSLKSLNLNNNNLESLSSSLGNFPNLKYLYISANQLSGQLPAEMSKDTSLIEVNFHNNHLTGTIPDTWTYFPNLIWIDLSLNNLDEQLPDVFAGWSNLNFLSLNNNKIPGAVPVSFSSLFNLTNANLANNQFMSLPDMSEMGSLQYFFANWNNLEFGDLEQLVNLPQLVSVEISPQQVKPSTVQYFSEGQTITIDAKVSGTLNHYTWYQNGQILDLPDTTSKLIIPNVSIKNAGTYWSEISNDIVSNNYGLYLSSGVYDYWLSAPVLPADSLALVKLYEATNGENWNNAANWLKAPVASWEGVIIENERVVKLELSQRNIQGGIPPSFANLDALEWLSLYENGITYLPGEFYGMTNLHYLDLDYNQISKIPPSIAKLTKLDTLWLGGNPLSGEIPKEIFQLTNLHVLGLYDVNYVGEFPTEIGNLVNLEGLWFFRNDRIHGTLPASIAALNNLKLLQISYMDITGGLENIASLTNLEYLYLYAVPATQFGLPSGFSNLTKMKFFGAGFQDMSLFGMPSEIFSWPNLESLQIVDANISGAVPEGFGNFKKLTLLNLRDNHLSGFFPGTMGVDSLRTLNIRNNNIDSILIFSNATKLNFIAAQGNLLQFDDILPFQGFIESHAKNTNFVFSPMQPVSINGAYYYEQLKPGDSPILSMLLDDLLDTDVSIIWTKDGEFIGEGPIIGLPTATNPETDGLYDGYAYHNIITPLTDLQIWSGTTELNVVEVVNNTDSLALVAIYEHFGGQPAEIFGNWLQGSVETWNGVYAWSGNVVGLELTGLSGAIPGDAIGSLKNLQYLSMHDGNLSGELPAAMFNPSLTTIDLSSNSLTGPIPTEIGNCTALEVLNLEYNHFTGALPTEIGTSPVLSEILLASNRFTGAVPATLFDNEFSTLLLDKNMFSDLPEVTDTLIYAANQINFEYNNFDFADLANCTGNLESDNTYAPQASIRKLIFTGDATLGGTVTLHAERQHELDEFYWFRQDKYQTSPYFYQIGYTANDSSITIEINEDYQQAKYMAVVVNPNYKYGYYPFLSQQISVDPYAKRYATGLDATAFGNAAYSYGTDPASITGPADTPPSFGGDRFNYQGLNWWHYNTWYHNAKEPKADTFNVFFEQNPIPVNYIRLHSPGAELNIRTMTLKGAGGESVQYPVYQEIYNASNQVTFPKTAFAVTEVQLVVTNGSVDALEIGDTGLDVMNRPVLDDFWTRIGPDYLYIDVQYQGFADYIIIERSTDGEVFQVVDSIGYTGWYLSEVDPGKYYYRARAVFEDIGLISDYSDVLETGNCTPTIPAGKVWAGISKGLEDGNVEFVGRTTFRDSTYINANGNFAEFFVSDFTGGWYDEIYGGEYWQSGQFTQKCDKFPGYSDNGLDISFHYENDTLYVDWWDYNNQFHVLSKLYVIGDAPEGEVYLELAQNVKAHLESSSQITLTWDNNNAESVQFVIQEAIGDNTKFIDLATVDGGEEFTIENTLDGAYHYYRIVTSFGEILTNPSAEVFLKHQRPLFDLVQNDVTTDISRTSYGGSWADFDGDGDDDLLIANAFDFANNFLYENTGNGTFKKIIGTPATQRAAFTRAASWGDFDNDGFVDLYVASRDKGDAVFRNTGSRSFEISNTAVTDKTKQIQSEVGIWVDLDNDGFVDVVNSQGLIFMNDQSGNLVYRNTLQNQYGPLSDEEVYIWTVSNVDLDNDGDQDLYFTSDTYNMLFVNDGEGNLTYVENTISNYNVRSRGYTWADFNNDGFIDLLTGDRNLNALGIYVNHGNLQFEFMSVVDESQEGITSTYYGRGYTVADFNNDGLVDVIWNIDSRASIALNLGNFDFELIPTEIQSFPETNPFSHLSLADVNLDGAMDILIPNQDATKPNIMYLSNGTSNSWISIKLKGIESNRTAIGAKVKVISDGVTQVQTIRSQNGISSGNSLAAEFGVGTATNIEKIEVVWPSGIVTTNENVAVNQVLTITEIPEAAGPTVNPVDSAILVKLYASTGGANWIRKQGWPTGSPLGWEGTTWTDGRLTSLILNENNLTDSIPDEIGGLSQLVYLDLSGNNLKGSIPSELGNLSALENLSLNNNQLVGKIPETIGALTNLNNLDLFNNALFGALPAALGNLKQLAQLELYNNDFIGFIPVELGSLNKLEILRLENNQFEGLLPEGLGQMSSLAVFYAGDNDLTGPLPSDLGNLKNLIEFKIQNNDFNEALPVSFAQLTGISVIDISNNSFEGSLEALANLDSMSYLNASGNHFTDLSDFFHNTSSSILVQNNWLDFGDFEQNNSLVASGRLLINPQDSLYERVDSLHNVGVSITISYAISGQSNSYSWKLDGEPYTGDNTNVFVSENEILILSPDSPQEGEYVLEVTNANYPEMKLITRPFNLKLSSLERDKKALLEFLAAVDADDIFKVAPTNWSSANELTSDWEGVTVENNRVTALNLPAVIDTDLSDGDQSEIFEGNIPISFADLTGIKTLNISGHYLKKLPNISNWPNLETADVTSNRMSFVSFLNNEKILGTKLTYIPQRRFGTTIYDTLKAGDDPVLFVDNQGTGAVYQWKFGSYIPGQTYNNDVVNIAGAISRVYQIDNLDYSKMGTYRVEVTHPKVPGLTLSSRNINIMAATDIYGTVYADGIGTILTDGDVLAFRRTPQGPYVREDTVAINSAGAYAFTDVVLGDFLILTKPNREVFPNTVDTYYQKAEQYGDATILELRSKQEGIDIQMVFYEDPTIDPKGADFEGVLFSDLTEDQQGDEEGNGRILSRKKVKRAACSMRRFVASGRADEEGTYELYAYVESDDEGNFTFTDIEEGKYLLNIEYPGVPMDPNSDIEFIVGGNKENQLFTLTAVITDDGIEVEAKEILYSLKPYIKDVVIYPNPTQGELKADFLVYRKLNDLKMEIVDSRGVKILTQQLSPAMGLQSLQIDLTSHEAGIYFMVFTDEAGTFQHQVKVSKF